MHIYDIISLSQRTLSLRQALLRNIILNYPSAIWLNNRTEKQEDGLYMWGRKRNAVDEERDKGREKERMEENEREYALARATCFN